MLSHTDSLLDHEEKIFWQFWGRAERLQDTEDLGSGQVVRFTNSMGIPKMDTNERWFVA